MNASFMSPIIQAEVKRLRSLHTGKGRRNHKQFLAEGVRLLEESIRHGFLPLEVYYSEALLSERGSKLVDRFGKLRVSINKISARDIGRICETDTSQGIAALFELPELPLSGRADNSLKSILYLDNISDPGNAGTLIRSAAAFGFNLVVFSPDSVEPYNSKVVRSSAGSVFKIVPKVGAVKNLLQYIKNSGYSFIAADISGDSPEAIVKRVDINKIVLVAIGSEGEGLSSDIKRNSTDRVCVGFENSVESLNASVAGSIIMRTIYESRRRI